MADKTQLSSNALMAFDSEGSAGEEAGTHGPAAGPVDARAARALADVPVSRGRRVRNWLGWMALALVAIVAITATTSLVALGSVRFQVPGVWPAVTTGRVTFETLPAGTEVVLDGTARGFTPLTLRLDPGPHEAVLRNGSEERRIPLEINAGGDMVHRLEFAAAPPTLSRLSIVTEPSGARVAVDGEMKGVSPLTVTDLEAGRHRIVVTANGATADRTVTTEAGTTTSVVFSLSSPAPGFTAGWLGIDAPFEVRVLERGEVIGTSAASKIMISPGSHEVDFVNTALGYQTRRRVDITSGRTATVKLDARAPVNINANPWAEVTIDGNAVGITPIANLVLTVGHHTVVFRHNELGEQRHDIVVTVPGPNRFSADLMR